MKKLLLIMCMLFSVFTYSQIEKQIIGIWKSDTSSYYIMVTHNEKDGLIFTNVSWHEGKSFKEKITRVNKNEVLSEIKRPDGWSVKIKYTLKGNNTMLCEFSGDINKISTYTKRYLSKK
tara:strand:+ start:235 stop:591 length:357 start_codon:yes stop_codon:yes gene_type:complete